MLTNVIRAKEILEVQGLMRLISKARRYYFASDFNTEIKKTIQNYSNQFPIFVDIGAGTGTIIFDVAQYFKTCIGIEPATSNYQDFIIKLKNSKFSNILPSNCALGKEEGLKKFYLSKLSRYNNRFGINPTENDDGQFESSDVEVKTLDGMLKNLRLEEKCVIKIDVEGAELDVMKGARQVLEKGCIIISEFYPWGLRAHDTEPMEYIKFMRSLGYDFFELDGNKLKEEYIAKLCSLGKYKKLVADDFLIKKTNC